MGMACNLRILFVLFVFVSFFCFFLCQSLTFFLSLNPNHSSSLFWFMGSWVWFMGSWVHAVSRLLIYGFDFSSFGLLMIFLVSGCWWFFWVHGFDYLLRKSIKEKKILIILIFWASFHLLFYRTWRTVLVSLHYLGFALVLGCSWFWVLFLVFLDLMEIRFGFGFARDWIGCWVYILNLGSTWRTGWYVLTEKNNESKK